MFYKLIGMVVWKLGSRYVRRNYGRRNYGRQLRAAAVFVVLAAVTGGYLATRSAD
jgi:hypothetical protein